jgi:dTDP-4-amino-4,6-dideoxygalactose transaminase
MEPLLQLATKHNLFIIEDTAQAIGAYYTFSDGSRKMAGTIGTIGTTSFFPSKNLGCFGDGGALFTNDSELAEKIRMIANHGQKNQYKHDIIGVNSRLDAIQAAILRVKLNHLKSFEKARNVVANYYDLKFENHSNFTIPKRSDFSSHVFHQYTMKLNGINRHYAVSFESTKQNFLKWNNINIIQGTLPESVKNTKIESVGFLHIDLNNPEIELTTLKYLWPKIEIGGIILIDDYGAMGYQETYKVFNLYSTEIGSPILTTAFGQGIMIKAH